MKKAYLFSAIALCVATLGVAIAEHGRDRQLIGDAEVRNATRSAYNQMDSVYRSMDWDLSMIRSENDLYWFQNSALQKLNQLRNDLYSMENAIRNLRFVSGGETAVTVQPWSGKPYVVYRDYKKIYTFAEVIAPGRTTTGLALYFDGRFLRTIDDGISQSPSGGFLFKEDFNDSWSRAQSSVEMEITFSTGERYRMVLPSHYVGPGIFATR